MIMSTNSTEKNQNKVDKTMATQYLIPWFCDKCGKGIDNHNKLCSMTPIYQCSICEKNFKKMYLLKRHQICHSDKFFKCSKCIQKFKRKADLKKHLEIHSDSQTVFQCNICTKILKRKKDLGRHMKIHEEKEYFCILCDKAFHYKHNLYTHSKSCFAKNNPIL